MKKIVEKGWSNPEWLAKHILTNRSHPSDWFSALLPDKILPGQSNHIISLADWTSYTNTKAMLVNAGQPGGIYPDFKPFFPQELKQILVPDILQGLSPSPQIKLKFKPQYKDPVNGNDMRHKVFGRNGDKRHKMFKALFMCQDPMKVAPSRKNHRNFKIDGSLRTSSAPPWKHGYWVTAFQLMNKQLVSKDIMQINNASPTRRGWFLY